MINVILIDDEEFALLEMEFLLKEYPHVNILGKFTNPIEALDKIELMKPHCVFIDINMPQLGGLDVTKKIQKSMAEIDVVFVTAYEQYAVEAFKVEAMDYLLKPVSKERLDQTVERLLRGKGLNRQMGGNMLELRCMGSLQVGWRGRAPIKWRTEKEKELFAFLLNKKDMEVSRDRIIDELWGEEGVDRAVRLLHNSIYYIKKTLAEYGVKEEQISLSKRYCLKLGEIWYDRGLIEDKIKNPNSLQTIAELEGMLDLFKGGYLQFEGWTWAEQDREFLRRYELDILAKLAKKYIEAGMLYKAEIALKNAFCNNPFEEYITYMLMELYKKNGEIAKATKHYLEYQKILKDELGIRPQESIIKIYESIRERYSKDIAK